MRTLVPLPAIPLAMALAVASMPQPVSAQDTGTLTGTVYDARTRTPVAGVRLAIDGTRLSTKTATDGSFRIERVPPGARFLRLEAKGYTEQVEEVLIDAGWTTGVDLELTPFVAMLDALIVEAGLGPRRTDARATTVTGDDAGLRGVAESLRGRVPGVQVLRPNGSVGGGGRILIRGINSVSLPNGPVIYVDGVRVQAGVSSSVARGMEQGVFALDFIDPATIDRIEVLRGPASAIRYGLESAGGVILIFTKKGS